jgi:hypothetical protein
VLYGQIFEYSKFTVGVFLIFHRTADHYVIITASPIVGDTLHKTVDPLGEKQERAVRALFYHLPTFPSPLIGFLDQKIR